MWLDCSKRFARWKGCGLVAFVLVLAWSSAATAQSDRERSGARSAARAGVTAYQDGNYEEAIDLLNRAESLVHAPPHLLFLARAHHKLGKLVEARELYMKVVTENLQEGAPKAFHEAQEAAREELSQVEAKIPKLAVRVGQAPDEYRVSIDGEEIPPALVGVPVPVNPGRHTVGAIADGKRAAPSEVEIAEGATEEVELTWVDDPTAQLGAEGAPGPAGTPAAPVAEPSSPPPTQGTSAAAATPMDAGVPASGNTRSVGYVLGGTGIAAASVGAVFGILAKGQRDDAMDDPGLCPDKICTPAGRSEIEGAETKALISTIGFGAGLALIGVGSYFIFTSESDAGGATAVAPLVSPDVAGLSIRGVY